MIRKLTALIAAFAIAGTGVTWGLLSLSNETALAPVFVPGPCTSSASQLPPYTDRVGGSQYVCTTTGPVLVAE